LNRFIYILAVMLPCSFDTW